MSSIPPGKAPLQNGSPSSGAVDVPLKSPQPRRRTMTNSKRDKAPKKPPPPSRDSQDRETSPRLTSPGLNRPPKPRKSPNNPVDSAVMRSPKPPQSGDVMERKEGSEEQRAKEEEKGDCTEKVASGSLPKKPPSIRRSPAPRKSAALTTDSKVESSRDGVGEGRKKGHSPDDSDEVSKTSPVGKASTIKKSHPPRPAAQPSQPGNNRSQVNSKADGISGASERDAKQLESTAKHVEVHAPKRPPPVKGHPVPRPPAPKIVRKEPEQSGETSATTSTAASSDPQTAKSGSEVETIKIDASEIDIKAKNSIKSPPKRPPPATNYAAPRTPSLKLVEEDTVQSISGTACEHPTITIAPASCGPQADKSEFEAETIEGDASEGGREQVRGKTLEPAASLSSPLSPSNTESVPELEIATITANTPSAVTKLLSPVIETGPAVASSGADDIQRSPSQKESTKIANDPKAPDLLNSEQLSSSSELRHEASTGEMEGCQSDLPEPIPERESCSPIHRNSSRSPQASPEHLDVSFKPSEFSHRPQPSPLQPSPSTDQSPPHYSVPRTLGSVVSKDVSVDKVLVGGQPPSCNNASAASRTTMQTRDVEIVKEGSDEEKQLGKEGRLDGVSATKESSPLRPAAPGRTRPPPPKSIGREKNIETKSKNESSSQQTASIRLGSEVGQGIQAPVKPSKPTVKAKERASMSEGVSLHRSFMIGNSLRQPQHNAVEGKEKEQGAVRILNYSDKNNGSSRGITHVQLLVFVLLVLENCMSCDV